MGKSRSSGRGRTVSIIDKLKAAKREIEEIRRVLARFKEADPDRYKELIGYPQGSSFSVEEFELLRSRFHTFGPKYIGHFPFKDDIRREEAKKLYVHYVLDMYKQEPMQPPG